MVELRKRKTPPPAAPPAKKKTAPKSKAAKAQDAPEEKASEVTSKPEETISKPEEPTSKAEEPTSKPEEESTAAAEEAVPSAADGPKTASGPPAVADVISLEDFGGEVETHEGTKVTLKKLVEESKAGVVLFTYPKASTPGCTKQACLFRDAYTPLTATGLSIYGLSTDSPKANTSFKTKQNLPYPLLCDPSATLIKAIGMHKAPKSTKRGVFVITKEGKVLAAEGGGPDATVEAVKKVVDAMGGDAGKVQGEAVEAAKGDKD